MAWTYLPKTNADWTGFDGQQIAFWNEIIRATNLRRATAGLSAIPAMADGTDGQTVVSAIGAWRDDTFEDLLALRWTAPNPVALGDVWDHSAVAYTDGTGWTQLFVDAVNAQLTAWGVDTMGATILPGGDIPWTRKFNDPNAPDVDYGDKQVGDIGGNWLFNEWRAALEVLTCYYPDENHTSPSIAYNVAMGTPKDLFSEYGEATSVTPYACADVKAAVNADYPQTWIGSVGTNNQTLAAATLTRFAGSGAGNGFFVRNLLTYQVILPTVTHGTCKVFCWPKEATGTFLSFSPPFDDLGDGYIEDEVSQISTHTADGTTLDFTPTPFPGTCDIDELACPDESVPEDSAGSEGGYVISPLHIVVLLSYPDP